MKQIVFSDEARNDIRGIPKHIAMNILAAIHRLAERGLGDVRELKDQQGQKRLRVGDYRVRFSDEESGTLRIHAVKNRNIAYR